MGTSLSFHKRYLYGTNRLVVTSLIVLLFLQIIQSAAVSSENLMMADSPSHPHRHGHGNRNPGFHRILANPQHTRTNTTTNSDLLTGTFSLKNLCSGRYVEILSDKVEANSNSEVKLLFERVPNTDNQFYLRRSNSKLYACMSRRGKLRIQTKPSNNNNRCAYTRQPVVHGMADDSSTSYIPASQSDNRHIKIQSVANDLWYVGFKPNGNSLKGWQHGIKRERCFHFVIKPLTTQSSSIISPSGRRQRHSGHRLNSLRSNNSSSEVT